MQTAPCENCGTPYALGPVPQVPICILCRNAYSPEELRTWVARIMARGD